MQSSRRWFVLAGLLAGCRNPGESHEILPMQMGEWKRKAVENIPGEQIPEEIKRAGFKKARRAFYQGKDERLLVTVYEMNHQTVAFELVQKWRPQENKLAFHQDAYFVTIEGGTTEEKRSLASAVEGVLKR